MGQRNLVVVSSPELAKEVLHTQGVEFGSRTRNVVFDIFTGKGQDMVFYGEHWRKMRRIKTVPFFTNKVVQQYRFGWEDEAARVVEDVKKNPEASTTGIVIRRRLQLMMYNNNYHIENFGLPQPNETEIQEQPPYSLSSGYGFPEFQEVEPALNYGFPEFQEVDPNEIQE
ncbi:cinnamate 4-hydroxylase C4H2 [Fagus crenata]